jgi:DNA repair protein RadD
VLKLRNYQVDALSSIYSDLIAGNTALCVLPTGSGKSLIMAELCKKIIIQKPDIKIIILCQRIQLVGQTASFFSEYLGKEKVGVYCATAGEYTLYRNVTVASIQSIERADVDSINMIVLDEAHNVNQSDGRYFDFIESMSAINPRLKVVAFTATPYRADGYIHGKDKIFKTISYRRDLNQMIKEGYLVIPRMKKVDHQFDISSLSVRHGEFASEDIEHLTTNRDSVEKQIEDALPRLSGRRKVIWCCSSIEHARIVTDCLSVAGQEASMVHSEMPQGLRDWNLERFMSTDPSQGTRHLVFITIVSEGWDYPPTDAVVLMRPIKSSTLYVQCVGRSLRPYPGKEDSLILDYGRVVETCGPLDDPCVPIKSGSRLVYSVRPMKFCPNCFEYVQANLAQCTSCEYVFPKPEPSLRARPDEDSDILSGTSKRLDVLFVSIRIVLSRSGNTCLKITYQTNHHSMFKFIDEYFVWGNEWAMNRMRIRLIELGVLQEQKIEDQVKRPITKVPSHLVVKMENKYPRVKQLIFKEAA